MWIVIALFLYAALNNIRTSIEPSVRRKNRYIQSRLTLLRAQYADLITDEFPMRYMELVAYSILIYETFNRPWLARMIERALFPWHSHTIGPMQVRTTTRLSDRESVQLGVRKLADHFSQTRQESSGKRVTRFEVIRLSLAKYNRDSQYVSEVLQILHILWAQIAPEFRGDLEGMYSLSEPFQEWQSVTLG